MTSVRPTPSPRPRFSSRDADFDRLFHEHAWEKTPLGPMSAWPVHLRGYVEMILDLPYPAIIFWGDDHLQFYNSGYATIMGPRHPRYLGATYQECWPDTYPTIHPWMERTLEGEVLEVVNAPFILTRHGFNEETYFTFSFSPLQDDSGKIGGILQLVVEKTREVVADRRRAMLGAVSGDGNTPSDMIEALSNDPEDVPFALLYLWNPDERRLVSTAHLGVADPPPRLPSLVERAFATNETQRTDLVAALVGWPHSGVWQEETRSAVAVPVRASAGTSPRGVLVLGVSPRLAFDGAYQGFFESLSREIAANLTASQERMARQEADRERQNLFDFFNATPAGLHILVGPDHRFLLANRSYLDLVDRDVLGRTVRECFDEDTVERFVPLLDEVFQTGQPFTGNELPLRFPGKPERIVNVSYTPFRNAAGAVRGILGFVYDITAEVTARQRSEQLAAELRTALRAREEFLGIASHELKTPLTSLRLQLQMAQRGSRLDAERLLKQANRLARLIDDMLDITRVDTGKLAINRAPVDLSSLVDDVVERFEPQFAAMGSTVRKEVPEGIVGDWDAFRVEQVVTNLVTNAIKYAPGKPIDIRATKVDGRAILTVADQGPGVAPHNHERIFRRFERAISANEVSGLGLGLFISRSIVESHGGSIRVENGPAGGATFVVELPLQDPANA